MDTHEVKYMKKALVFMLCVYTLDNAWGKYYLLNVALTEHICHLHICHTSVVKRT